MNNEPNPNTDPIIPNPPQNLPDSQPGLTPTDGQSPQTEQKIVFTPFPDGSLFRYAPNPKLPGSFALVDSKNNCVGVVQNVEIADLLCRGAALMIRFLVEHAGQANRKIITPR